MIKHQQITQQDLLRHIRHREIRLAGNVNSKIYGLLNCGHGKRMHKSNRVFFNTIEQALKQGFRPCGHCLKVEYGNYKANNKAGSP